MRVFLAVLLVIGFALPAVAETIDLNITELNLPDAKPGFIFSADRKEIEATVSSTVVNYQNKYLNLNLDVGLAPAVNEPIAAVAFKFGDLSQYGLDFPLRKYFDITVGVYTGLEFNDLDQQDKDSWDKIIDYGVYATVARITF